MNTFLSEHLHAYMVPAAALQLLVFLGPECGKLWLVIAVVYCDYAHSIFRLLCCLCFTKSCILTAVLQESAVAFIKCTLVGRLPAGVMMKASDCQLKVCFNHVALSGKILTLQRFAYVDMFSCIIKTCY